MPDIDIDFVDRDQALTLFEHIPASRLDNNRLVKHNTGVYLHAVPVDAVSGLCQIPYEQAEEQKYFKIDFLNVGIYKGVRDEEHLHGDIIRKTLPTSVEQLSAVLAMIRPAKRYLIGKDWTTIMTEVWTKPSNDEYYFKKSHATAYAVAIVVQMNLICEQISYGYQ